MEKKSRASWHRHSAVYLVKWLLYISLLNSHLQTSSLTPGIINSGHFDVVEDISWEPGQNFFISVSKDQTSRFHGIWRPPSSAVSKSDNDLVGTWHELGRPQIHGYDLQCVAFIDRFKFVSGADEKLLRIFESPRVFLKNYFQLSSDESVRPLLEV
jgi:elongator complex protein 2